MAGGWKGSDRKSRLPSGWSKIRARILARDPICKICGVRPSAFCDHIVAKADDHSDTGLQGLCGPCHDQKSAREGAAAAKAKGRPTRQRPGESHPGIL
ncbi:HNH endonuclease [Streptomyces phaeochromogenes]|uniref:HNH endonuclease signature motif containing protein n=1 Tax=Streptomyces phaeochromogenes TaxID=1923 RepID=UPI002253325B|nr:HNH endonuclease signature motif containing protein [Streptomyces phaeochromogenes]MCX5598442.1 HNH endonuclease [Streptomyces phaeochromogenes]